MTYVDNASNRRLGRVGLPKGSFVVSRDGTYLGQQTYVDNSKNRSLGRVGLFRGSQPEWECDTTTYSKNVPADKYYTESKPHQNDQQYSNISSGKSTTGGTYTSSHAVGTSDSRLNSTNSRVRENTNSFNTTATNTFRDPYLLFINELDQYAKLYSENIARGRLSGIWPRRRKSNRTAITQEATHAVEPNHTTEPANTQTSANTTEQANEAQTAFNNDNHSDYDNIEHQTENSAVPDTPTTIDTSNARALTEESTTASSLKSTLTGTDNSTGHPLSSNADLLMTMHAERLANIEAKLEGTGHSSSSNADLLMTMHAERLANIEAKLEGTVKEKFVVKRFSLLKAELSKLMQTQVDMLTRQIGTLANNDGIERRIGLLKYEITQHTESEVAKMAARLDNTVKKEYIAEQLALLKDELKHETKFEIEKMSKRMDEIDNETCIKEQVGMVRDDIVQQMNSEMEKITRSFDGVVREDFIDRQINQLKDDIVKRMEKELTLISEGVKVLVTKDGIAEQLSTLEKKMNDQMIVGATKIVKKIIEMKDTIGELRDAGVSLKDEMTLLKLQACTHKQRPNTNDKPSGPVSCRKSQTVEKHKANV